MTDDELLFELQKMLAPTIMIRSSCEGFECNDVAKAYLAEKTKLRQPSEYKREYKTVLWFWPSGDPAFLAAPSDEGIKDYPATMRFQLINITES